MARIAREEAEQAAAEIKRVEDERIAKEQAEVAVEIDAANLAMKHIAKEELEQATAEAAKAEVKAETPAKGDEEFETQVIEEGVKAETPAAKQESNVTRDRSKSEEEVIRKDAEAVKNAECCIIL